MDANDNHRRSFLPSSPKSPYHKSHIKESYANKKYDNPNPSHTNESSLITHNNHRKSLNLPDTYTDLKPFSTATDCNELNDADHQPRHRKSYLPCSPTVSTVGDTALFDRCEILLYPRM